MSDYVYLVENADRTAMKIGYSSQPEWRTEVLGCSPLYKLRGGRGAEKRLHYKFRHLCISGEWFKHSSEISGFFIQKSGRVIRGEKPPRDRCSTATVTANVARAEAAEIRRIAKEEGLWMSEVFKEAITMWLKAHKAKRAA